MRLKPLLLLVTIISVAAQPPADTQSRIQRVEKGLAERMAHFKVAGVSIAVFDNYEIEWAKGYGVLDTQTHKPVDAKTVFQAASISKPVAASAALHLVEAGKLSLDTDVNRTLKSWRVPENEFTRTQKVTLRRILSHSAGLTVHGFPGYAAGAHLPTLIEILDGKPPANTPAIRVDTVPGSIGRYSGGGYTILQLLLTEVTGEPLPKLLREVVLGPLAMSRSAYAQPLPSTWAENAASGYYADGRPVPGKYHTYPELAAAGLWTTPSDLARFGIEIQKSREGRSNRVLSEAMTRQMLTPQKDSAGLGLFLMGTAFGHNGANEGFQCLLQCSLEGGKGVAIMTNSDNGGALAQEILHRVEAEYRWH
jgi:CubicO group peptidase (beta-lactamase class C family)